MLIGFFDDGTLRAAFTSHRFETYHDFWGEWKTEDDSLTLTSTGGNDLPLQSTHRGWYEVRENELFLHRIVLVDDFEGSDFEARWWSDIGEGTASFTCAPDQPGHDSAQAMRLTFEGGADSYAGCGTSIDPGQWENTRGLSSSRRPISRAWR